MENPPDQPSFVPPSQYQHFPQPNEKGIQAVKELCFRRLGKQLSDKEAYVVLSRTMNYIWAINMPDAKQPSHETIPASPEKPE